MKFMSLFGSMTGTDPKDCFDMDSVLFFVVKPGDLWKALGKQASNLKRLEQVLKKKIRIIEFAEEKLEFIQKAVLPLKISDITENEEGIVTIKGPDTKTKGLLIGRNAKNLRNLENIIRRYFEVKEIKVV